MLQISLENCTTKASGWRKFAIAVMKRRRREQIRDLTDFRSACRHSPRMAAPDAPSVCTTSLSPHAVNNDRAMVRFNLPDCRRQCSLWVKSRHRVRFDASPLYPRKRTLGVGRPCPLCANSGQIGINPTAAPRGISSSHREFPSVGDTAAPSSSNQTGWADSSPRLSDRRRTGSCTNRRRWVLR